MAKVIPNRAFEVYDPPSDLVKEEECDTLLVYLPGFKKEELRVQLTPSQVLKISGERPLGDSKYRRFHKEFHVTANCDIKHITAKFESGILYIRQPKLITPVTEIQQQPQLGQEIPKTETPETEKTDEEARKKEKAEMGSDECRLIQKRKRVFNDGLFRELRKPDNLKKLCVSVSLVAILGFCISYMFKSCMLNEQTSLIEYNRQL